MTLLRKKLSPAVLATLILRLQSRSPRASGEARSAIYGGTLKAGVPVPPTDWGHEKPESGDYSIELGGGVTASQLKSRDKFAPAVAADEAADNDPR